MLKVGKKYKYTSGFDGFNTNRKGTMYTAKVIAEYDYFYLLEIKVIPSEPKTKPYRTCVLKVDIGKTEFFKEA